MIGKILYKFRFYWFGLLIAITIFLGISIKLETDNSLREWFSKDDPHYIAYQNYLDTFEKGSLLLVVVRSENIFSLDILHFIKQITEELEDVAHVVGVHSLANANKIIGTPEGIEIHPLLSELKPTQIQKIKKYALKDELFRNYLISPDGKLTAIAIALEDMPDKEIDHTIHQVEEIVNKQKPTNIEVFVSGEAKAISEINRFTKQNQNIFSIPIISCICICIFILFRSFYKNFIILLVIGMSICWALGFYSLLGYSSNAITGMILPLIIILSISDSVHIIKHFEEVNSDHCKEEAFIRTVQYITVPCFITSITTALGLLALSVSKVAAIKRFGIGSAAGIIFAFLISITIVPFFLTFIPSSQRVKLGRGWNHFLNSISDFNEKKFKYILVATIIGFIVSFWGITKVRVESNRIEWFPKKSDFYKSTRIVDKYLSGVDAMEIVLEGEKDVFKKPSILKRMDDLSDEIERLPRVKKAISVATYVKRIHRALHEDNPEFFSIPDSQSLIAQELFLFTLSDDGRVELESYVTPDYSQGRISIKTEIMPSEESVILGNLVKKMVKETFNETELKVTLTGTVFLYNLSDKYIIESQIKGFSLAFLSIIIILFLIFWSIKYGGLSLLPNLFPITFVLAIMGWSDITLNTATVMVASIALGIAVDDTVHFITRFKKEYKSNGVPVQEVLRNTTVSTGQAIIFTSIINTTGFLLLLVSGFQPTREFGILIALTLFFALIGDLIVLPASIMTLRKYLNRKKI
jgi:predicted RND superfamily exporter protein